MPVMKETSVDLYFFSGAGNTLLAAMHVAEALRGGGLEVRMHRLEKGTPSPAEGAALGVAVTTACFSTYPFAWEALRRLPDGAGRSAFGISTMAGYSGGLRGPLRALLEGKGYVPVGYAEFLMPTNYGNVEIPEEKNRARVAACRESAEKFARRLMDGAAEWRRGGPLSTLFDLLGRRSNGPWRLMRRMYPLKVDDRKCIQCGRCVRLCPTGNIVMNDYPRFLDRCVVCQRCFAFCPTGAIHVPGKSYRQYRAVEYETLTSSSL